MFGYGCETDDHINPINGKTSAVFNPSKTYGSLIDQDGNVYKTITIGSQTWMAENLRTTKYRNGEAIPEVTDSTLWKDLSSGAYCNYENTKNIDTIASNGRLYNWFAIKDSRQIAPEGWHVPTFEEWIVLETYLGGDTIAGGKLKESGTQHWRVPNVGGTNETGFTALPGGYRMKFGNFYSIGAYGYWWTATESATNTDLAWHRHLSHSYIMVGGCECGKGDGYSIRCVKD